MSIRDQVLLDTLGELPKTMLVPIHCEHCGEVVTEVPPSCVELVINRNVCEKCSVYYRRSK